MQAVPASSAVPDATGHSDVGDAYTVEHVVAAAAKLLL